MLPTMLVMAKAAGHFSRGRGIVDDSQAYVISKHPYTPPSMRNREKYRDAKACVQAATMKPTMAKASGPARWQNRSSTLPLENRYTHGHNGGENIGRRRHEERINLAEPECGDQGWDECRDGRSSRLENDDCGEKPHLVVENGHLESVENRSFFFADTPAVNTQSMDGNGLFLVG